MSSMSFVETQVCEPVEMKLITVEDGALIVLLVIITMIMVAFLNPGDCAFT